MEEKIGFIGTGTMGSRMVERLLIDMRDVTLFNRNKDKVKPLLTIGAHMADTIPDLVAEVGCVCICVSNDEAVKDVMRQVLSANCKDKIIINLSTISPDTAKGISKLAANVQAHFLDAPVSGSAAQVESGQLVMFVGGEEDIYNRAESIFNAIGKGSYYLGPAGNGSRMKLVANTLLGLGVQALAEALLLGQRMGMEKEKIIEVLSDTVVVSKSQKIKMRNALTDDYPAAFSLANMYKDFGLILEQAHNTGTPMPATAAAEQMSAMAMARKQNEDFAVVIRVLEDIAYADE